MTEQKWFDVSKSGLAKQAEERGAPYILTELVANALDERFSGVTEIIVKVDPVPNQPYALVRVIDNSQRGYGDQFADAWTLFAESYKRGNPSQSGQFNLGCKLWLSLCDHATIETTSGAVEFSGAGRKLYPRRKRERGTEVTGKMKIKREQLAEVGALMHSLILPAGVHVIYNGKLLECRKPLKEFEEALTTKRPDADGVMKPTTRKTLISIYEADGDQPMLYELGIPVVESPCGWHVNIGQKVPLNKDRDNVTPAYSRKVKTHVANNMRERLTAEDGRWAGDVFSDPDAKPETINTILDKTEGKQRLVYDPSDPEANMRGAAEGHTVIPGSRYTKDQWRGIRKADATPAAGKKFPTPKAYSDDPNADPAELIPKNEWTDGMANAAEFSQWVAVECLGVRLGVNFVKKFGPGVLACYVRGGSKGGAIDFNMAVIGNKKWFNDLNGGDRSPLEIIVHELAHHWISNHFAREDCDNQPGLRYFYDATGRVGVLLAELASREPEKYRNFLEKR